MLRKSAKDGTGRRSGNLKPLWVSQIPPIQKQQGRKGSEGITRHLHSPPKALVILWVGRSSFANRGLHGALLKCLSAPHLSQSCIAGYLVARRGGEGTNWDSRLPYLILGGDTPLVPKYTECTDIQCRKFDVNNNEAFYSKILMGSLRIKFPNYVCSNICGLFRT